MKKKLLFFIFFLSWSSISYADSQTSVSELINSDNKIKINSDKTYIESKPSVVSKITESHNTQKQLDINNQQHTLDITLETKRTEQRPDGTIIITETKPSNITIEALSKKSEDYKTLDDTLSKLGMALLLFKNLGGL